MERARDQLLSCPCLAQDAKASLAGSNALDLRHKPRHHFSAPHQLVFAHGAAELAILFLQPREAERIFQRQ